MMMVRLGFLNPNQTICKFITIIYNLSYSVIRPNKKKNVGMTKRRTRFCHSPGNNRDKNSRNGQLVSICYIFFFNYVSGAGTKKKEKKERKSGRKIDFENSVSEWRRDQLES